MEAQKSTVADKMQKQIAVIDYGLGNVASVIGAIEKIGHAAILTRKKDEIFNADGIILPGVGAFGDGMENLNSFGLVEVIRECALTHKIPFLGICLGMQLMASKSCEFGEHTGLGLIEGDVIPFEHSDATLRKIHIGWNDLLVNLEDPIFANLEQPIVYFVHSYHFVPKNETSVIAKAVYGQEIVAGIRRDNIVGLQFHPEKSQKDGLKILENFVGSC